MLSVSAIWARICDGGSDEEREVGWLEPTLSNDRDALVIDE
jgi:hypothetical protein